MNTTTQAPSAQPFEFCDMESEMNVLAACTAAARAKVDVTDIAHVADALQEITRDDDRDAAADDAADLLDRFPARLGQAVENWEADRITWKAFVAEVRACL
jgi:hypothetical protein